MAAQLGARAQVRRPVAEHALEAEHQRVADLPVGGRLGCRPASISASGVVERAAAGGAGREYLRGILVRVEERLARPVGGALSRSDESARRLRHGVKGWSIVSCMGAARRRCLVRERAPETPAGVATSSIAAAWAASWGPERNRLLRAGGSDRAGDETLGAHRRDDVEALSLLQLRRHGGPVAPDPGRGQQPKGNLRAGERRCLRARLRDGESEEAAAGPGKGAVERDVAGGTADPEPSDLGLEAVRGVCLRLCGFRRLLRLGRLVPCRARARRRRARARRRATPRLWSSWFPLSAPGAGGVSRSLRRPLRHLNARRSCAPGARQRRSRSCRCRPPRPAPCRYGRRSGRCRPSRAPLRPKHPCGRPPSRSAA